MRYGCMLLAMEPDHDGSHGKGLMINALHTFCPQLLRTGYLKILKVPSVRATKRIKSITFHMESELKEWMRTTPDYRSFHVSRVTSLSSYSREEARNLIMDIPANSFVVTSEGDADENPIWMAYIYQREDRRNILQWTDGDRMDPIEAVNLDSVEI